MGVQLNADTRRAIEIYRENKTFSYRQVAEVLNKEFGTQYKPQQIRDRLRGFARRKDITLSELRNGVHSGLEQELAKEGIGGDDWNIAWLKNSRISVMLRNNKGQELKYEDMRDELVKEMKKHAPKYKKIKRKKINDPHLLVIDPADVHVGKLSIREETGGDYNIDIAVQRCIEGVEGIVQKASNFPLDKILLVIGNDILHIDTPKRTTTSGTPQDTDGMWWQAYKAAKDMYIEIIERLVTVADVHIIHNPSNHDYTHGTFLADIVLTHFHHSPHVSGDVSIMHRKYYQYGNSMIATTHGDGAKEKELPLIMAQEQPQMWAKTKFRYWYCHHFHHKMKVKWQHGKDYIGVTVEYLRSPGGDDSWHHRNGYLPPKAIEGFIHSKKHGQLARFTHYF